MYWLKHHHALGDILHTNKSAASALFVNRDSLAFVRSHIYSRIVHSYSHSQVGHVPMRAVPRQGGW